MNQTNVFVGGLHKDFTKTDLELLVMPYGRIQSAKIMINLKTGESLCYGFVDFFSTNEAFNAIQNLDKSIVMSKKIHLKFASSGEKYGKPTCTVFAKSLPLYYNDSDIKNLFSCAGKVLAVKSERSFESKKPIRGYYVMFQTESEAYSAIKLLDNTRVVENGWPLFIRFTDKIILKTPQMIKIEKPRKTQANLKNLKSTAISEPENDYKTIPSMNDNYHSWEEYVLDE